MMALAEFLLARIANVEATARDMQHQERAGRPLLQILGGGTGIRDLVDPGRVLAECEAKRQIVLQWQECQIAAESDDGGAWAEGMAYALDLAMQHLALPYADHPDYREEWRP